MPTGEGPSKDARISFLEKDLEVLRAENNVLREQVELFLSLHLRECGYAWEDVNRLVGKKGAVRIGI